GAVIFLPMKRACQRPRTDRLKGKQHTKKGRDGRLSAYALLGGVDGNSIGFGAGALGGTGGENSTSCGDGYALTEAANERARLNNAASAKLVPTCFQSIGAVVVTNEVMLTTPARMAVMMMLSMSCVSACCAGVFIAAS